MSGLGRLVASGRTSEVFAWGADAVVKIPRPGVPPHWARVEAAIASAVHQAGLPCPEVRGLVEIDDREAIAFERIDGPSLWDLIVADPASLDDRVAMLVDLQQTIHRVDPPLAVPKLAARLGSKILAADGLGEIEREEASAIMATLPPGDTLCHGDLHPANVLISDTGPVAIDWFDAVIGPPTADIARTSLLIRPLSTGRPLPHLPGATVCLLERLHECYVTRAVHSLSAAANGAAGRPQMVDELLAWERVQAAGRLAEHTTIDRADLLTLWRSDGRDRASALANTMAGSASDELEQSPLEPGGDGENEIVG